jgi:cyclophilin family peptidyl-prolyl cis-trans isomerase
MFCYLDLDVDDCRASFKRASQFVEGNSIKYGLSSNNINELGGREKISVAEYYDNDFVWSAKGRCAVVPQPCCRIVFELYPQQAPLATENFVALCSGSHGRSKGSGAPLSYVGSVIHRYVPGFIIQGGDFIFGNGTGGESIFGKKFKDDPNGLKGKHDQRGVLSMGNSGKNSNSSQFFVTLAPAPVCDRKHVVFGKIVHGLEVLDLIEERINNAVSEGRPVVDEKPAVAVVVTACGLWVEGSDLVQGYWAEDDTFKPIPSNISAS